MHSTHNSKDMKSSNETHLRPLIDTAKLLGASTTMLAIYGYFVMHGVADALSIDGGSLWGSASDVFHYAFLGLLTLLARLPTSMDFEVIQGLFAHWLYWFYTVIVLAFFYFYFKLDRSTAAYERRRKWWMEIPSSNWLRSPFKGLLRFQIAVIASTPIWIPALLLGIWFVVVTAAATVAMFALLGIQSGTNYVADQRPSTPYCVSATVPQDQSARPVRCVRVRWQADGQTQTEVGILITSTSSYALLMQPGTSIGKRVPLSGQAILEPVDHLGAQ